MSKRPLKVPPLPLDFWRRLDKLIEKRPYKLNMGLWHGTREGSDLQAEEVQNTKREGTHCNTTHCMAGFATFLTPGGLRFEAALSKRNLEEDALEDASLQYFEKLLKHSIFDGWSADDTAGAAALIFLKSGWYRYMKRGEFIQDNETARRRIKHLANLEARREAGTLKWKESPHADL